MISTVAIGSEIAVPKIKSVWVWLDDAMLKVLGCVFCGHDVVIPTLYNVNNNKRLK